MNNESAQWNDKLDRILDLELKSAKHRQTLLNTYADILTKSENRIDNINKIVANLVQMQTENQMLSKSQCDVAMQLAEFVKSKERRIESLEEQNKYLQERYDKLLDEYMKLAKAKNIGQGISVSQLNRP